MADSIWNAVIDELGAVQYSGWFAFHNYNEPLADPSIFSKVAQARKALDHAKLTIFTNGDYLNTKMFGMLASLGVNQIRITLYPSNASPFVEPQEERIVRYLDRVLGIHPSESDIFLDHHLQAIISVDSVELHFMAPFVKHYHNRGGAVRLRELNVHPPRSVPCFLPFLSAAIDYRGNLKLCCEIYDATLPQNQVYNIGNISNGGFLRLWFSERMNHLRDQVALANFTGLPACKACRYFLDEKQLAGLTEY